MSNRHQPGQYSRDDDRNPGRWGSSGGYEPGRDFGSDQDQRRYGQDFERDFRQDFDRGFQDDSGRGYRQQFDRDYGQGFDRNYGQGSDRNYGQGVNRDFVQGSDRNYRQNIHQNEDWNLWRDSGPRSEWTSDRYGNYYQMPDRDFGSQGSGNFNQDYDQGRVQSGFSARSGQQRSQQGPYSGKGPKGYQRSPERLKEQVCEILENSGYLDASEIEVEVKDCEVTLSGKVESREDKREAERCAESVTGIKDVHNRLTVDSDASKSESRRSRSQEKSS